VSLGFVDDVFEVMAQVDYRLTKVTLLTYSLGLTTPAENLGRHSLPPLKQNLVTRFDNKIRATSFNKAKVTKWKIYSLIFLGSENSGGAKDTWALLTASTQFMRTWAMDVYMEN
jgi:hypothetical protein